MGNPSETNKSFSDVETVADAENRGRIYLNTYSQPFIRVTLFVPSISNNYKVGEKVSIQDIYNNEYQELVINKIKTPPERCQKGLYKRGRGRLELSFSLRLP
jgi:hypothetical protein